MTDKNALTRVLGGAIPESEKMAKYDPNAYQVHKGNPRPSSSPHAFHDACKVRQVPPLAGDRETLHGDTLAGGHVLHRLRRRGNLA